MVQLDEPGIDGSSALLTAARAAAERAAMIAQVRIGDEHSTDGLRDVAALLAQVWGTPVQTAPIPADLLQSISHAGCNVAVAHDGRGVLCGASVAIVSPDGISTYSLIAGVLAHAIDHGVGFALKQYQRAWALERGFEAMLWTFDPLVSRNARFNLTKLGASASEYSQNFYGAMDDRINAGDESDRLTAVWNLTSKRVIDCSAGQPQALTLPQFTVGDVVSQGPDGNPILVRSGDTLWCRAPSDIVALRMQSSALASEWRRELRHIFTQALDSGHIATGVTRAGWYRLEPGDQP